MFNGNNLNISGESGFPALIGVNGNDDSLSGGSVGNDTIWSVGDTVSVTDTTPGNLFGVIGSNDTLSAGPGNDTIWADGNNEVINGGANSTGSDLIGLIGNTSLIQNEGGNDSVYVSGNDNTVAGGSDNALVVFDGSDNTFADNTSKYNDTIVGFDNAAGDTIKLSGTGDTVASTTLVNGGTDTQLVLSDGSEILLKGVTNVSGSFFS